MTKKMVTGNYTAAYGAMRARAEVVAAYPITPQTFIVEYCSEFVNNGDWDCEYVAVESEHSAMSACVSATATGVRSFTATSSQGLALMHEVLYIPPALHLPMVMAVVNRTVAAPIGIWCEHNDTMGQRDSGWLQCYCEENQEVQDMILQAYKVSEHEKVLLPIMVNLDAFILSHTVEPVDLMTPADADKFLPKYKPKFAYLDPDDPMAIGTFTPPEYIQEVRYQTEESTINAKPVIQQVNDEFAKMFGRNYGGMVEEYSTDGADAILVTIGTVTATARDVVDEYRAKGKKVGLVKMRWFRPYPTEQIIKIAEKTKALGIFDRAYSFGSGGPGYIEARNALYGHSIPVMDFIAGLGGRDVTKAHIQKMFDHLLDAVKGKPKKNIVWLGTRGVD
jgi:pyruvate/2-oxoacid:ferredoxin oxidoreductase alpha subunit